MVANDDPIFPFVLWVEVSTFCFKINEVDEKPWPCQWKKKEKEFHSVKIELKSRI